MNIINSHTTARKLAPALFILALLLFASVAFAQEANITFPIAELGGCESKEQCKTYCDDPAHIASCVSFAEESGLMSPQEAEQARTLSELTGPGGCRGSECRTLCDDPAYRSECTEFAREHGIVPPPSPQSSHIGPPEPGLQQEGEPGIDEDKAMRIVEEQGGPGGCRTKDECRAFCDIESNVDTCLAFAAEHNLMSPEDLERARKMMAAGGPGGCRGLQCRAYCENPDHAEECLAFAEEQGFIPREEAEKARRLMNATGPGGCRGIECKRFCEDPAHHNECFEFAVENGFISEEEAAHARTFMQKGARDEFEGPPEGFEEFTGPGGCRGAQECSRYCAEHPDECRGFGPSHSRPQDFGQDRTIESRELDIQPEITCSTPEECRALYEERAGELQHEHNSGEFSAEHERQYQQYREQYESSTGEFQEFISPEEYQLSGDEHEPPPEDDEPSSEPSSRLPASSFVASVFSIVAQLLGI